MGKTKRLPEKYQIWIEARKRFHLSHAHIQMARELGMNPKKFGKLANHKQEPWTAPLPLFIEHSYFKRFGKERPDDVQSSEQRVKAIEQCSIKMGSGAFEGSVEERQVEGPSADGENKAPA